jgi:hypothetical protein
MDSDPEKGDATYQKSSKNHQKNKQIDNYDIKKRKSNIFYALKCHENAFYIVGIVKE